MTERRKLNPKDPNHLSIIIKAKLEAGQRLIQDPKIRATIEGGVAEGQTDQEIASSIGEGDPKCITQAIRTTRWKLGPDVVPTRTPKQNRANLIAGGKRWRDEHPDLQEDHQRKAARGAQLALTGKQVKYTDREINTVRQVLARGDSYQEAAQALSEAGVLTTVKQVKGLASRLKIPYPRQQIASHVIRGVEDQVLEAAIQGKTRRQILEELGGEHRATVRQTLTALGVRDRINWNAPTPIKGKTRRQLALEIHQQAADTATAHQQFNALLEQHQLPPVSLSAFSSAFPDGVRKRK